MSFLVDINPKMELPKYKLTLHKLNEESIGSLKNITDFKISPLFVGIHNMSFNVPLYIINNDGTNSRNYIYDMVEGDHLVKLNDMSYFIITNVKEFADDNGKKYKEVQCKSREYGFISKKLTDYKADSRVLYDPSDTMLDGLEKGILNYIFKYLTKSWTLDYVDPDLILREGKGIYRELNFADSNLTQVFMELQKIFNCIFTFDSLNRKVNVYDIKNMMGQDRGLHISDNNFIKRVTKDVNSDGIVTRLFLRGKDGVSIQSISPTGQPYIDNFEYYKNTKYMSQGLIDALNTYQAKVSGYNPDFEPLFVLLNQANTVMEGLLNADGINLADKGLVALKSKLSQIQTLIDAKVEELGLIQSSISNAEGTDLSSLYATKISVQSAMDALITERTTTNGLISTKESEITAQQVVIDGIENQIKSLQYHLDMNNPTNFTESQLIELDDYIKIETFSDSNYTEHNLQELKEEGVIQLNRLSQPPIQFEVDSVDFLSIVQCQHMWKNFVLGDIVTLEHKDMGFKFVVRLVGYDHDVDSHSLNLKFSSTNSYDDATLYERDLMEHVNNIGTTVDFNVDKWNDVGNVESRIAKLVDAKLEDARQNILNAVGQKYLFGDNGLWLYKENPDGTINKEQIRAINNTIGLTDDNWATPPKVAITPQGIVAERIYGKLGEFAIVNADQVNVGSGGSEQPLLTFIDAELTNAVSDLGDVINNAFIDTQLTNIEANSIKLSLDNVTSESLNLITTATSLSITTEKNNYSTALNTLTNYLNTNWLGKTYPLTITVVQRTNVANYFKDLENRKSILLTKITEVRAAKSLADAKTYTDTNALKQNFAYNNTKITQAEGIEVFDNLGNKVLQTGSFPSVAGGVKDMYGHVAYHSDGSFSALVRDGFLKKNQYGSSFYLNDIYITSGTTRVGTDETDSQSGWYVPIRMSLPARFRGKLVQVSLSIRALSTKMVKVTSDIENYMDVQLKVSSVDTGVEAPYVDVYGTVMFSRYDSNAAKKLGTIEFSMMAIGS